MRVTGAVVVARLGVVDSTVDLTGRVGDATATNGDAALTRLKDGGGESGGDEGEEGERELHLGRRGS